jgi:hypothetical protein
MVKKRIGKEPKPEDLNPLEPAALAAYHQKHPRNLWVIHQLIEALKRAGRLGCRAATDRKAYSTGA